MEEIGFGLTRRNKKDEGEEEVGGRQRSRKEISGSAGQQGTAVAN